MCGSLTEHAKFDFRCGGAIRRLPGTTFAKLWCISFTKSFRPGSD